MVGSGKAVRVWYSVFRRRKVMYVMVYVRQLWRFLSRYERFVEVLYGSLGSTRRSTVRLASVRQFRLVQAARCPVRYCMAVMASSGFVR